MEPSDKTCIKCASLQSSFEKLTSERECLLTAQQYIKNPDIFSTTELQVTFSLLLFRITIVNLKHVKPLLQDILSERSQYLEQIQQLQVNIHKTKL